MGSKRYGDWKRIVLGAAIVALGVLTAIGRASAGQETVAGITGTVTDESQSVMPGVTVTVTSPSLQGSRESGDRRAGPVPNKPAADRHLYAGVRVVGFPHAASPGSAPDRGTHGTNRCGIERGGLEETVTVSGASPVVDVTSTSAYDDADARDARRDSHRADRLQRHPGAGARVCATRLQALSPTSSPNFRAFGQSNQAYQSIDGVITTSPLLAQTGQYIDGTAFEEAVISTLGHDASIPTRGIVIATVVKSGSNNYHGQAFFGKTGQALQADNITPELKARGVGRARRAPAEGRLERRCGRPDRPRQACGSGSRHAGSGTSRRCRTASSRVATSATRGSAPTIRRPKRPGRSTSRTP